MLNLRRGLFALSLACVAVSCGGNSAAPQDGGGAADAAINVARADAADGASIADAADASTAADAATPGMPTGLDAGAVDAAVAPPVDAPSPVVTPDAAVVPPVDAAADTAPAPAIDAPVVPPPAPDAMPAMPPPPGDWWKPTVGMTWDWQLAVPINPTTDVQVFDIDLFDNAPAVMSDLHARGRKVICYVDLGSWEDNRADAGSFPMSVLGATYDGFPHERWLDIRRIDLLSPIVRARLDLAKSKGCDAVEPDNMDGYDTSAHESSGFPLTYADQIAYNKFVAGEAHARGMAVGLKNDINQVQDLVSTFDFHVSEQCFQYDECSDLMPFIEAGKPIFEAEYSLQLAQFCPMAETDKISAIRKKNELDAYREACTP